MVTVTVDISKAIQKVDTIFDKLRDKEYLLRPVAIETIANMKPRIHQDGKASDGNQIGEYSNGYLKTREKAGRGKDKKVVVSLTRQLEEDWVAVPTQNGYGIGFNNPFNFDKAKWVEEIKKRIIFNLTAEERDYVKERITELTDNAINQ